MLLGSGNVSPYVEMVLRSSLFWTIKVRYVFSFPFGQHDSIYLSREFYHYLPSSSKCFTNISLLVFAHIPYTAQMPSPQCWVVTLAALMRSVVVEYYGK